MYFLLHCALEPVDLLPGEAVRLKRFLRLLGGSISAPHVLILDKLMAKKGRRRFLAPALIDTSVFADLFGLIHDR